MSRGRRAPARTRGLLSAIICSTLVLAACNPHFGLTDDPVQRAVLTSATGQSYTYSGDGATVSVHAADTNTDGNVRELFWTEDGPFLADQQACNTWLTPTGTLVGDIVQPGLALRIAPSGPDGESVRAITVNENIWSAAIWYFHVNLWDSSAAGGRITEVAGFDLSPVVGKFWADENDEFQSTMKPGPWHVCARTQGLDLTFKVWTGDDLEPGWDDPVHVYSTVLPEGWDYPGYSGGYVGHVNAGETAVFAGQTSVPLCLQPDMIGTAFCQQEFAELGGPSTTTPSTTAPSTTTPSTTTASAPAPAPATDHPGGARSVSFGGSSVERLG